jgi:hypothetical protein
VTEIRRVDIAFVGGVLMGVAVLYVLGFFALRDSEKFVLGNDFAFIWVGPAAVAHGANPYDVATWNDTIATLGPEGTRDGVYDFPAWTTLALLPLGVLPLRVAAAIWAYGGLALTIGAMFLLTRDELEPVPAAGFVAGFVTVASQPAIVNFYDGEFSMVLTTAAIATILGFRRRRELVAALGILGLALKPNVFAIGFPALLRAAVARGQRRTLAVVLGAGALSLVASFVILPTWVQGYAGMIGSARLANPKTTVLPYALREVIGDVGVVVGVLVLLGLVMLALRFDPRSDAYVPVWLAVAPLVTPYLHSYDQLVMLPPAVVAIGALARRSARRAYLLAAFVFVDLVIVALMLHDKPALALGRETLNAFVAVPLGMLVLAALWRERRSTSVS